MSAANERLRLASGEVDSNDPLVGFLYDLMRDHLPVGVVEKLVRDAGDGSVPLAFTNGWLAQVAMDQAKRLRL